MDFLFRIAILAMGYFYPAYKCFKVIDCGKPKSEQLHAWCQYWIVLAVFTGCERVADTFISWLPFYSGAKLAFVVYLWHPDTKGTEYVFQTFLKPFVSKHTQSVDFNFGLLRDETVRALILFWNQLIFQLQSRASELLHRSVAESSAASGAVQDNVPIYPSIPASFYPWNNVQQQRQPFYPGHQPLITHSSIWPDKEHKQEAQNSASHPHRSLIPVPLGQQKRLSQLLGQTDSKVQGLGALATASGPPRTEELKDNRAYKGETDFELVHAHEVPKPEAATFEKGKTSAHGVRSRWWW